VVEPILVDNDVILKLCCYGCHGTMAAAIGGRRAAMLSVGRYALRDRVKRSGSIEDRGRAVAALEEAFGAFDLAQPNEQEVALAAEMEEEATRRSLEFDAGESQLLAMLLRRSARLLLTGDKRAIVAIHGLVIREAEGRIACFEQLMTTMLEVVGPSTLRDAVCAEPKADRAITVCFACAAADVAEANIRAGLASYVSHLRSVSGATLLAGDDLATMAA